MFEQHLDIDRCAPSAHAHAVSSAAAATHICSRDKAGPDKVLLGSCLFPEIQYATAGFQGR